MNKMDQQITGVKEQITKLEEVSAKIGQNSRKNLPKSPIRRRPMSAELLNELLGSLPLENAFGLLVKIPNDLLARNVRKMINNIKEAMKNNKLNEEGYKLNLK